MTGRDSDPTLDENGEPFTHSTFPPDHEPEEGDEDHGDSDGRSAGA